VLPVCAFVELPVGLSVEVVSIGATVDSLVLSVVGLLVEPSDETVVESLLEPMLESPVGMFVETDELEESTVVVASVVALVSFLST